jgi:predicted site-specific integrase-resolvase
VLRLADWARKNGLDYKTAYRLFRSGKFPRPVEQLPTGTILVHELPVTTNNAVLYARVSSGDQAADLDRQVQRLRDYAAVQGLHVVQEVQEIGSGLNGHRKKLMTVLEDPSTSINVVEHRDRLARFGSEYIESALAASDRKVIIVNDTEMKDDLVQDMVDALTSFCARLNGKRAAKNKARRALEATER